MCSFFAAENVADSVVLPELLHGEETKAWGDQAYRGQTEAIREAAPLAQDLTNKRYRYKNRIDEVERVKNRNKSRVRSKVEHVFAVIKRQFGYVKVRYRGIRKNANPVRWLNHVPSGPSQESAICSIMAERSLDSTHFRNTFPSSQPPLGMKRILKLSVCSKLTCNLFGRVRSCKYE